MSVTKQVLPANSKGYPRHREIRLPPHSKVSDHYSWSSPYTASMARNRPICGHSGVTLPPPCVGISSTPGEPADTARVETFVTEMDKLLRREHQEDYCGIVYANDLQTPGSIKIYDPNNLGVSCGYNDNRSIRLTQSYS